MDTVPDDSRCSKAQAGAELEAVDRISAARLALDAAMLGGAWLDADVLREVSGLVLAAARWQQVAEAA